MAKLADIQIESWIRAGECFEGRSDGNGLYLRCRAGDKVPVQRSRYRLAGKSRVMLIGSYNEIPPPKAREVAGELFVRVAPGFDIAGEKKIRKAAAIEKVEQEKSALRVSEPATECFERQILGCQKHPDFLRQRINKDINPHIDSMKVEGVRPRHIDTILQSAVSRGVPAVANDVLRWTKRISDYVIKRHTLELNPAGAFDLSDTGGQESSRIRWLTHEEPIRFFQTMRTARRFSRENELTMELILCLCCHKMKLCGVQWDESGLDEAVWYLPAERVKDGDTIDTSLPPPAVSWLRELRTIAGSGSKWVPPAWEIQHRMIPHIQESTLPVVLAEVHRGMPEVPNLTIHDFGRTAHTHLAALGIDPVVIEHCLNHCIKGVKGIYSHRQYSEERRATLELWVGFPVSPERGEDHNVIPLSKI